ncbi:hypothetical protein LCGC14_1036530 [marine sediment metagenome]|uniref:Uncharacterized protein n=1 Tax=marine sediment metagenome TaxID=412755 RepID=A0A0F9NEN4_9ZZZZ
MAAEHRTDLIPSPPIQTRVYPLLIAAGFAIVLSSLAIAAVLATVASGVFDNPKSVRDAAEVGSALLARQGDLATFPLWVQPFKFVGLTLLISSIFTVFWGLLRSLQEARGAAMVESIPVLLEGSSSQEREGR